nr:RusA family crossover junction endodeoxyribonuclease [Deinococcus betulae]
MVLPRRPVSYNARGRPAYPNWKAYVAAEAKSLWTYPTLNGQNYYFQIIYICHEDPVDVDNIIKPIQDALVNVVYSDDVSISDVSAHRRFTSESLHPDDLPDALLDVMTGSLGVTDVVYLRLCEKRDIGSFV